jgi:hypothetical protein
VPNAPIAPCAKGRKHTVVDHRFTGTPGISCAMALTVSFVLFPVTGFVATVIPEKLASQGLDASIGASEPHDFAVRESAARLSRALASTASQPNVRDDRDTPLAGAGMVREMEMIWVKSQRKSFF